MDLLELEKMLLQHKAKRNRTHFRVPVAVGDLQIKFHATDPTTITIIVNGRHVLLVDNHIPIFCRLLEKQPWLPMARKKTGYRNELKIRHFDDRVRLKVDPHPLLYHHEDYTAVEMHKLDALMLSRIVGRHFYNTDEDYAKGNDEWLFRTVQM